MNTKYLFIKKYNYELLINREAITMKEHELEKIELVWGELDKYPQKNKLEKAPYESRQKMKCRRIIRSI